MKRIATTETFPDGSTETSVVYVIDNEDMGPVQPPEDRPDPASRRIVDTYMAAHPEAWDDVKRATYAYHNPDLPNTHRFAGAWREATCMDCGRSREQVRWDDAPPECAPAESRLHWFTGSAPWAKCRHCGKTREVVTSPSCAQWKPRPDIRGVIRAEEERFARQWERAKALIKTLDLDALTGEHLSYIHQTHGVDPSMVETAMVDAGRTGLSDELLAAYEVAYDAHCAIAKAAHKAPVVVGKTI